MKYIYFFCLIFSHLCIIAQEFPRGIPDEKDYLYESVEQKVSLTRATYRSVESRASVKQFAPYPSRQVHGTCAAFATAYAARTIVEAQRNAWTDKTKITENAFAPGFIYKITVPNSPNCWGAFPSELLTNMQKYGVPKLSAFSTECPSAYPNSTAFAAASPYKIKGFVKLFGEYDDAKIKVQTVKKSLSEGNPVVASMICPNSFDKAGDLWQPTELAGDPISQRAHARHAVSIVSYDDTKYGGAFEIMNSWGTTWGNQGFTWVSYANFASFFYQALEVLPLEKPKNVVLAGKIRFEEENGQEMQAKLGGDGYQMLKPYPSGTRFRMFIANSAPCYLYAFGSDLSNQIYPIFPTSGQISAALTYSKSEFAIPNEEQHIRMDNQVGTDFMCIIYAKEALDIEEIKQKIRNENGTFQEKVQKVLSVYSVEKEKIHFSPNEISFNTDLTPKSLVSVVLSIKHL